MLPCVAPAARQYCLQAVTGRFYVFIHLLQVLNVNLSSTKFNNLFKESSVSLIVLNGPAQKPFLLLKEPSLPCPDLQSPQS
jgi:hypothetical protein